MVDLPSLETVQIDGIWSLPNKECQFKVAPICLPTNHYCGNDKADKLTMIINGRQCCGLVCCNSCMDHYGLEGGSQFICPKCSGKEIVHGSFTSIQDTDAGIISIPADIMPNSPGSNPLLSQQDLLKTTLNDKSMLLNEKLFFDYLQEAPVEVIKGKAKRFHFRPKGTQIQHKGIYTLAKTFVEMFERRIDIMKMPQNRAQTIAKMCNLIYTSSRAGVEKRRNISEQMHPHIWEFVKEENDDNAEYYICRQADIFAYAIKAWGVTDEAQKATVASDYCRAIGCFLLDEINEELDVLQGGMRSMDIADDPKKRHDAIFSSVAHLFNNERYVIKHPTGWDRCTHLSGWEKIDPNDPSRISIKRSGIDMKHIYEKISSEYKRAMKNYTKGTGGGSGAPEDFEVWETRDATIHFNNYAKHTTYLTWIHLADKDSSYVLYSKYEGLPIHCKMDGDESHVSSMSERRSPKKRKENDLMTSIIASTKAMNNTIAQSTNDLIKAVAKSSEKQDRSKKMIMDDMTNAHFLLEKSIITLKKKRKRLVDTASNKDQLKSMLGKEIESVKVHKGNLSSLENELREINKDNIGDFDLSDIESE